MSEPSNNLNSASGKHYWRSLDELADTPEFKEWLHREFPAGASEFVDDVSRRHFLKIMSASFALAGLGLAGAGCRRPEEKLEPFGQQPGADYVYGQSEYFATAMPTRTGAVPLVVKSYEGRPIKIEGNSLFPGGNGGTDRYAQASILNLYDPDRARQFKRRNASGKMEIVSREDALNFLNELSQKFAPNGGEGLAFLAESNTSPSRDRLQKIIAEKFPKSKWFTYDAIDSGIHQRAATQAFGRPVKPVFRFDKAKVILSLDCDFIGDEDDCRNHIQKFIAGRKAKDGMSRLYQIESLFTLTGSNADHRLRIPASNVIQAASAILAQLDSSWGNPVGNTAGIDGKWISECVKDLKAAGSKALVVAGQRQQPLVHWIAYKINSLLGSVGETLALLPTEKKTDLNFETFEGKATDTLVILGGNPAYHLPWFATEKSKSVVRLGYYEDETSEVSDWNFPLAHYLESWGDVKTSDGTIVPIQPLIQPLFGGLSELEFLARIAGETETNPHGITRATFGGSDEDWKKFLFNGFKADSKSATVNAEVTSSFPGSSSGATLSKDRLEVVFYRDSKVDDGRYANNGWMQELPDPITRITWDNAVLISRKTASELNVKNGDIVEIELSNGVAFDSKASSPGGSVRGAIWVQPGMADYSLGLALGYGRKKAGRIGNGVGFDAYQIFSQRNRAEKYIAAGATIKPVNESHLIATTQSHWSMEGRPQIREANYEDFVKNPEFADGMHGKEPPVVAPLYPNPLDEAKKTALHQWGMAIDLTACVGCGTCVVACQSENNIPIVGKDQVNRGREMHWLRIDRYYTSDPKVKNDRSRFDPNADQNLTDTEQQFEKWIDDVQAIHEPMLCQHCEAAPCENVCPVNATVHDQEGLNVMAYNRCIGTRYCSNNCPYKVRRFNFLDYNKRPLEELNGPVYSTPITHKSNGKWDLATWWNDREYSMRPEDEWDLIKLSKNPDVTVHMRGVMEKCTFCTQRIEEAKIAQKVKAGGTDNVRLTEAAGTIPKTACQQACPAGAIVFGDISDPNSTVSKWKDAPQNYAVLGDLLTKPRTTYLARIRNPNPKMPDYHAPYSTEEYESHLHGGKAVGQGIG